MAGRLCLYMALKVANGMKNWWSGTSLPPARQEGPCCLCRRKRGRDRLLEVRAVQVCGPVAGGEGLRQQKGRADFGATSPSMSLPTRWMHGWAARCLSWMPTAALPVWRAARRITSLPTVSCGATRCTTGPTTKRPATRVGAPGAPRTGIYDLLRIDHFRGFDTYWAIPADSTTARTGKWENGPGMELFDALEPHWASCPSLPRTWASCSPACASCWPTAPSRA